jgi:hypothetical protein
MLTMMVPPDHEWPDLVTAARATRVVATR